MKRLSLVLIQVFILTIFISCEEDDEVYIENSMRVKSISQEHYNVKEGYYDVLFSQLTYSDDKLVSSVTTLTGTDEYLYKVDYNYSTDFIESITSWMNPDGWHPHRKLEYIVNGDNIVSIALKYNSISGYWVTSDEFKYFYSGDKIKLYEYYRSDYKIELVYWLEMKYDGDNISELITYGYNSNGEVIKTKSNKWFYKDGVIDYILMETNPNWDIHKYYYTYDGAKLIQIEEFVTKHGTNEESLVSRITYSYNIEGYVSEYKREGFDMDTGDSIHHAIWTYEYEKGKGNHELFDKYLDWKVYGKPSIKSNNEREIPVLFPFYQIF